MNASLSAIWDGWNAGGGPRYPQEKVVQFTFRNFPANQRRGLKALDLGCGSGVHTRFLAREGFEVSALDISDTGVRNTQALLSSAGLAGELAVASIDAIPHPDSRFDVAVCISVLECVGPAIAARALGELVRVLAPGGKALLMFASAEDFRIQGANTYGLHGFTEAEVDYMLPRNGLALRWIDRYITTHKNQAEQQNDFLITLQKEYP